MNLNEILIKIDRMILLIREFQTIDGISTEALKIKLIKFIDFFKELISMDNYSFIGLSKEDKELIEEGIQTFFNKILKGYNDKDEAVKDYMNKEDGFFNLIYAQNSLISIEAISNIILNLDWKHNILDIFTLLNLYKHKFEAFCSFLKPFVEKFFESQVEIEEEQFHNKIYHLFLNWLDPNLQELFKKNIDIDLRHAVAHASYTVNINDGTISLRKIRRHQTAKMIDYKFDEFLLKLNQLNEIINFFHKIWSQYIIRFFENVVANDSIEKMDEQFTITRFINSMNYNYFIKVFEEFKLSLINLEYRKKLKKQIMDEVFKNLKSLNEKTE